MGKWDEDVKLTLGAEIFVKYLNVDDTKVVLQIWDFAGEDSFKLMLPLYSQGSNAGIFMYDVSKLSTLNRMEEWNSLFQEGIGKENTNIPIMVVGGKLDLIEDIADSTETKIDLDKIPNLFEHKRCSAKNGKNVELIFELITRKIMNEAEE